MIVAGSASPLLLSSAGGYNLTRSLRFRSSASAYLNRTPASAGNRKTWTWSAWVKRGVLGSDQVLFSINASNSDAGNFGFGIDGSDKLYFGFWTFLGLVSTQVLRDPSAWYHIVLAFDSTQATASNRAKLYVNGVQVTAFDTNNLSSITQNADYGINSASATSIFRRQYNTDKYTDGYLTEVNFIDGQALTPSSFGETSATTGVWQPKKYSGTYGTNGFYLPFTNNSTTTTLGNDFSGNGNNWTTNNISLTAGATYDSMTDVPTLTSATQANFAVMNPLDQAGGLLVTNGNLTVTANTGWDGARATFGLPTSGKYYWEATCISRSTGATVGILSTSAVITGDLGAAATGYVYNSGDGQKYNNGSGSSYGATWGANDIIGVSWDADTSTLAFFKNGVSQGTAWSGLSGSFSPAIGVNGSDSMAVNFGQRPFAYTPPTGFVALNTFNLPTPTIGATASTQANKYMDISLWTGNGASQSISGLNFQPSFTWIKVRSNGVWGNVLFDSVRGALNYLSSNDTSAQSTNGNSLTSFDSNGFSVGPFNAVNQSGQTFVGWNWRASNTTPVTNTAGSITSTVSANTSSGFSIVTWTAPSSGTGYTIGHGLGVSPSMIIIKGTTAGSNWWVWNKNLTNSNSSALVLNSTGAASTGDTSIWDNTNPTSTVFSQVQGYVIAGGNSGVAYCFAEVAGFSRFGSYTGNGSSDGTFVYTGFRPRYIMVKRSDSTSDWTLIDTSRSPFNVVYNNLLAANLSNAEFNNGADMMDILSNGFKLKSSAGSVNASSGTYIYMAFAENPFKYSLAR